MPSSTSSYPTRSHRREAAWACEHLHRLAVGTRPAGALIAPVPSAEHTAGVSSTQTEPVIVTGSPQLGQRFVAGLGAPRGSGWLLASALFGPELNAVLDAVAARRGADSRPVAAALLFEQYCARIVPPLIAAAVCNGIATHAPLDHTRIRVTDGVLTAAAIDDVPVHTGARAPRQLLGDILDRNLRPAMSALRQATRLGQRVLDGSVANAIATTLLHRSWHAGDDAAADVDEAVSLLAELPQGERLVNLRAVAVDARQWFYTDRNTCCLAFRTSVNQERAQRFCATCPAMPRSRTEAMFRTAASSFADRRQRDGR